MREAEIQRNEREREGTLSLISLWELIRVNEPGSVAVRLLPCLISSYG